MNYIILVISLFFLTTTIILAILGRETLSQRYQKWLPTWADMIIFGVGLVGLCFWKHYMPELDFALAVVMAGFWGHVTFPNKERY